MKIFLKNPIEFQKLMKQKGFSQTSFSENVSITRSYVHKIIHGQSVGPGTANKICTLLDVKFEDIFLISVLTNESRLA